MFDPKGSTMTRSRTHRFAATIALGSMLSLAACAGPASRPAPAAHDFSRWEPEIAAFESADRARLPAPGGVLFIGSSTIRMWTTLAQDFPGHQVLNRGFGGSEIVDSTHFADRIIFPYRPRQVFLRAGGNDIHAGRSPEDVAADFSEFVRVVHGRLPETEVVFISLSPAPVRWAEKDKNQRLNQIVREMAVHLPRVAFVDCFDLSLTADGKARPELFIADQLHFNAEGYKLLAERVRPYLRGR
jgi:lysophospholipase L1-like esterase